MATDGEAHVQIAIANFHVARRLRRRASAEHRRAARHRRHAIARLGISARVVALGTRMDGGETNESSKVVEETNANIGATIMGRNMFGGHPGGWNKEDPWQGWWGNNPPFHHPVFVLTHHARAPLELEGGNRFTFVTEGIESALAQARKAAAGKDIALAGGAKAAQQYLAAGLVDEMYLHLVPTLLGAGERLFEGVDLRALGYECTQFAASDKATHVVLERRADDRPARRLPDAPERS